MIAVNDIIAQVRIDEKDMDAVRFSDWDIINALNKALRVLTNYCATKNTDFFDKSIHYSAEEARAGAVLPDDYITVRQVVSDYDNYLMSPSTGALHRGRYVITDNRIYANTGITMYYKRSLPKAALGGSIELPPAFFDVLAMAARVTLTNAASDALTQYIASEAEKLMPRRKYANVKIGMDFFV